MGTTDVRYFPVIRKMVVPHISSPAARHDKLI
jgi:hypothetical protein